MNKRHLDIANFIGMGELLNNPEFLERYHRKMTGPPWSDLADYAACWYGAGVSTAGFSFMRLCQIADGQFPSHEWDNEQVKQVLAGSGK